MKFDVSLSPFGVSMRGLVEAARVAEAVGFDGVWTHDHMWGGLAGTDAVLDPWVSLAAIASATGRVELGPLVLNTTIRQPAHIAVASASLHELSGGRSWLGLGAGAGAGVYADELRVLGLPLLDAAERRDITERVATTVRSLWRGDPAGFPRPEPEPPIVIGVNGRLMGAVAGRVADAVNIHDFQPDLEDVAEAARDAAGDRPFQVTIEAELSERWMVGVGRERVEAIGATRLGFRWTATDGVDGLEAAAARLGIG